MRHIFTVLLALVAFSAGHSQAPQTANESPRPLQGRALENLVAFTRLMGYVRYFHPSDEAAATNWEQFAANGVKAVESAASPIELARILEDLFRPVAPTLRVYPSGQLPSSPDLSPPASVTSPKVTAWRHFGVGLSTQSIYWSRRLNRSDDARGPVFGNLMQSMEAAPYRGKRVRYRAAVKVEPAGDDTRAQMWLRVDRPNRQMGFFDNMQDRPIRSRDWSVYEIAGEVAADAERIYFGTMLMGGGSAWVDSVSVEILEEVKPPAPVAIPNAGFEQDQPGVPAGWMAPVRMYMVETVTGGAHSGLRSARISAKASESPQMAKPLLADLGAGVSCLVPSTLYLDDRGTVPKGNPQPQATATLSGNDRATRLAAVALAWNIFQHFYPYFDVVQTDWPQALRNALPQAAIDTDEIAFLGTLRRLVGELRDGHGSVTLPAESAFRAPFAWRLVENRLVITHLLEGAPAGLEVGDIVSHVDGRPANEALTGAQTLVSGSTAAHRQLRAWRILTSGPQGSVMELRLRKPSGEERSIKTQRLTAASQYQEEKPPEKVFEIQPGILYADLRAMTDAEFDAAVPKLAEAKGIVFELRGYPRVGPMTIGHLIDTPVTCARWNVPVVQQPDRAGMTFEFSNWTVQPKSPRFRAKVAFLTDARAISYAETYLGIIEHYKLADIVGDATAGTNGNVNPFTLPGGYRISWTGMKVLKHDGSQHHGIGIQPTVRVWPTIEGVRAGRDEVLERGVNLVSR